MVEGQDGDRFHHGDVEIRVGHTARVLGRNGVGDVRAVHQRHARDATVVKDQSDGQCRGDGPRLDHATAEQRQDAGVVFASGQRDVFGHVGYDGHGFENGDGQVGGR